MGIRLDERDLAVMRDTARFRGLTLESIRRVHFNGSTYAWKRLASLYEHGYLERKYFYEVKHTAPGTRPARRIAAFYYPTPKGLKKIGYVIDPRYVVPIAEKLDVHHLISELYAAIPGLLGKREAMAYYNFKRFMPVSCVVPQEPPLFICISGRNRSHGEVSRLVKFIHTGYIPGRYIAIARHSFAERLLLTEAHFIPWDLAAEVVPTMAKDPSYYLERFISFVDQRQFKGITVLAQNGPFVKVKTAQHQVFNLAELFTGSTRLMLMLRNPPENAYVFCDSLKHLSTSVRLESGSIYALARKEKKLYQLYAEDGKTKHRVLSR